MSAFDPDLACADVLRLVEAAQLSGTWSWRFAPERHSWSPGLFHLLGLDPLATPPGYERPSSLLSGTTVAQAKAGARVRGSLQMRHFRQHPLTLAANLRFAAP